MKKLVRMHDPRNFMNRDIGIASETECGSFLTPDGV